MNKVLFMAVAACTVLAACNKQQSDVAAPAGQAARVTISLTGRATKADFQTADEAKVSDIKAFVFNGNSLDAYDSASAAEITAKVMEVDCTQGSRDIWIVVNGPASLASVTTKSDLKAAVSRLTADNASDAFVMVGKAESQSVTASFAKTIAVDRIVSRVRLFQVRRDMSNPNLAALAASDFKIVRAYMTCVPDNACYDVFTPTHPSAYSWLSASWANSGAIATTNSFIYDKLASAATLAEDASYGTAYADESTVATHTFYVYPNEFSSAGNPLVSDQMKLVVECQIDGQFYTYPIPLGAVSYNKSYDVKMLTITKLGNNSDGDDDIDDGEDDVILPATATFTITVNDWTQVLNFGGVSGGNISI